MSITKELSFLAIRIQSTGMSDKYNIKDSKLGELFVRLYGKDYLYKLINVKPPLASLDPFPEYWHVYEDM